MPEHTVIKRVCSKCKKVLGYTEGYGVTGTSHGLCAPCRDAMLREAGLEEYITEDFDCEDMKHEPASCNNPMCQEPACVETRHNRMVEHAIDPEDLR